MRMMGTRSTAPRASYALADIKTISRPESGRWSSEIVQRSGEVYPTQRTEREGERERDRRDNCTRACALIRVLRGMWKRERDAVIDIRDDCTRACALIQVLRGLWNNYCTT